MHPTLFLHVGFRLAATVLLAIIPVTFAIPSPLQLSPRGVDSRDLNLKPPISGTWPGLGCFRDDPNQPTLTSEQFELDPEMTVEFCIDFCISISTNLAGVENGKDCRCGNVTTAGATTVSLSLCNIPCVGNGDENCGGYNILAIYGSGGQQQLPAAIPQNVGSWSFQGCFNDSDTMTARTLTHGGDFNDTLENCMDACGTADYHYAGMGGGIFCWCDNQINQGKTPIDSKSCMLPCPGDNHEICGGPDTLVIYKQDKRVGSSGK